MFHFDALSDSAAVTSGLVTQCRDLPKAPEHLKGLGVLTKTQPVCHVTVQVAASLSRELLPDSTMTQRVRGTERSPANSCQEEACCPTQSSQMCPSSSTFNKLTFLLWTLSCFHNCALCSLTQSLLTFMSCPVLLKLLKAKLLSKMHQFYVIKTHPVPSCTVYPICQVKMKLRFWLIVINKGHILQLPLAASNSIFLAC